MKWKIGIANLGEFLKSELKKTLIQFQYEEYIWMWEE